MNFLYLLYLFIYCVFTVMSGCSCGNPRLISPMGDNKRNFNLIRNANLGYYDSGYERVTVLNIHHFKWAVVTVVST